MKRVSQLIVFRNLLKEELFVKFTWLMEHYKSPECSWQEKEELFYTCVNQLLEISKSHGFEGNLWHAYLTFLLANDENSFSLACEKVGDIHSSMREAALLDFRIMRDLFACPLDDLADTFHFTGQKILIDFQNDEKGSTLFNKRITERILETCKNLEQSKDEVEFLEIVDAFYKDFGVGKLGLHKAFRIVHEGENKTFIEPITKITHVKLDDLIGYELPKERLLENTKAFVEGKHANNCLLYGDAGTGKSTCIKAITNQFYEQGLRVIEVYKHQFQDLNAVISEIKSRNYKFILYMDDLSFEEFEIEYKYLKAVIEGGLEEKPKNVLIYATSNRRHLVREKFSDREENEDDKHQNDTVAEKLSLVARFGEKIYFGSPSPKEFKTIVLALAQKNQIQIPEEELLLMANRWELSHGGLSGRTAQQFMNHLLGSM